MISKHKIVEQINEDWSKKLQSEICIAILNYLLDDKSRNLSHITYGSLQKVVGNNYDNRDLLIAIQYLCGDKIKLLEAKFELIDEDNFFDISNYELKNARKTGKLVHPDTGELITDFEKRVFIYFQPSSLVKKLHN